MFDCCDKRHDGAMRSALQNVKNNSNREKPKPLAPKANGKPKSGLERSTRKLAGTPKENPKEKPKLAVTTTEDTKATHSAFQHVKNSINGEKPKPPAPKTNDRIQSLKPPPDRPTGDPSPNSKPEEDYYSDAIQRIEEERRKAEAILDEKNDECKLLFTPRVHKMSCWDITWLTGRDITSRDDTGRGDIRPVVARYDNQRDAWQMSYWDMIGDLTGRHITSEDDAGPKDVRRIDTRNNNQRDAWQMSCWDMIGDLTGNRGDDRAMIEAIIEAMIEAITEMTSKTILKANQATIEAIIEAII
jgi:hypothetical protein